MAPITPNPMAIKNARIFVGHDLVYSISLAACPNWYLSCLFMSLARADNRSAVTARPTVRDDQPLDQFFGNRFSTALLSSLSAASVTSLRGLSDLALTAINVSLSSGCFTTTN